MNDEGALARRPRQNQLSAAESTTAAQPPPRLIIEIPLECRVRLRVNAGSLEDERRLRVWLRTALERRESMTAAITKWLDEQDEREAA
jgi:hypothetical protein